MVLPVPAERLIVAPSQVSTPIDDELIARRGRRDRPPPGSAPSTVKSVRLEPELKERITRRAEDEGVTVSEVIREALRQHLEAS